VTPGASLTPHALNSPHYIIAFPHCQPAPSLTVDLRPPSLSTCALPHCRPAPSFTVNLTVVLTVAGALPATCPAPMASLLALEGFQASPTYQIIPNHQRTAWLDRLQALGTACDRPYDGEIFQSPEECLGRLNAWGFLEGAAFTTKKSRPKHPTPNWLFSCSFHSDKTKNSYQLEAEVARDEEGKIVTKRQRNTVHQRKGCLCEYRLSYKKVTRDSNERVYLGIWVEGAHNGHQIPLNPFSFQSHLAANPEIQLLQTVAYTYRRSGLPYSEAYKLLQQEGQGLVLKPKQYYNLVRKKPVDKTNDDTIDALIFALTDAGFRYRTLTEDKVDEPSRRVIRRKLIQIFFFFSEGLHHIRRFCPRHLLIIDGTWNTNNQRLPLLIATRITNEGKTFPVAFSYCPGETAESYLFFLECLQAEIFVGDVPFPAVILADQAPSLLSAADSFDALPNSSLQFCSWHVAEAMIARFRKARYTSKEIEGYINNITSQEVNGLRSLIWRYIQSTNLAILELNRQALLDALH
jgi:MULE transposase domain